MSADKAKQTAEQVLVRYGITRMTPETLLFLIEEQNYEVVDLNRDEPILSRLGLPDAVTAQESFVYRNGNTRLLFVSEKLDGEELGYVFAHELGHILLGHLELEMFASGVRQEYEANEFAHHLLHPSLSVRCRALIGRHKRLAVCIAAFLLCMGLATAGIRYAQIQDSYFGEYYVTQSGNRYHRKDCPVIRNKTNLQRLTKEKAEKYQPCSVCLPEGGT